MSVFHVKNLENPFKPNRRTILLNLKLIELVALPWRGASAGFRTLQGCETEDLFVLKPSLTHPTCRHCLSAAINPVSFLVSVLPVGLSLRGALYMH